MSLAVIKIGTETGPVEQELGSTFNELTASFHLVVYKVDSKFSVVSTDSIQQSYNQVLKQLKDIFSKKMASLLLRICSIIHFILALTVIIVQVNSF